MTICMCVCPLMMDLIVFLVAHYNPTAERILSSWVLHLCFLVYEITFCIHVMISISKKAIWSDTFQGKWLLCLWFFVFRRVFVMFSSLAHSLLSLCLLLSSSSSFLVVLSTQGEKDWEKYEVARKLKTCVDDIRNQYLLDLKSREMGTRQRAVALYFIDKVWFQGKLLRQRCNNQDTKY